MKKTLLILMLFFGLLLVGSVSAVPPDVDDDGCVSLTEISSYVYSWLQGSITLGQVSSGVSWWLQGCFVNTVVTGTQFLGANRAIDWNPGVAGGIPFYNVSVNVMDYGAVGDGVVDDTNAIKNAIAAAPVGTAVYLPPGTYKTSSPININKGIALRGAGIDQTKILCGNPNRYCISIEYGYVKGPAVSLVSGYNKGSTKVTLSDASTFQVGKYVEFRQRDDPAVYMYKGNVSVSSYSNIGQFNRIVGKSGNTITLEKPLYYTYNLSFDAYARTVSFVDGAGLENFYLALVVPQNFTGASGNIVLIGAAHSWIKNIWSNYTRRGHVFVKDSYANEVRDSVFYNALLIGVGGDGAGIYNERSTDNLYINNVFSTLRSAMSLSWGANGNVFAYNFNADPRAGDYANGKINDGWINPDMSMHGNYPYMNLFEGNVAQAYLVDNIWGQNGPTTLFRSRVLRESQFVKNDSIKKFYHVAIDSFNKYQNIIANELGKPGQLNVGYPGFRTNENSGTGSTIIWVSLVVNDTTYVHGNYEYLHNTYVGGWNPALSRNIPDSLFLTSKPAFFGNMQWPAFGPEYINSGNKIPAQVRYETLKAQGKI